MSWPSIQEPSYPLEEEVYKPQIKTEFEAGYVQSRPRATISKRRFKLTWQAMDDTDLASLQSAFASDVGSTFSWTHPVTSTAYTVRYVGNGITSTRYTNGVNRVMVELEQA